MDSTEKFFQLTFPSGQTAQAAIIHRSTRLPAIVPRMGLCPRPTLVLVGGASGISDEVMAQLRSFFVNSLAPLAEELNASVVDGGTDAGVMRLIGQARTAIAGTFSLVGVPAIGTVHFPNQDHTSSQDSASLEPNHTHFVMVPGKLWGDEVPWIARFATALATNFPSITFLINGGKIAWQDVTNSVKAKRPVIVMGGSGRTADELAAAIRGDQSNERAVELVHSGLLKVIELNEDAATIRQVVKDILLTDDRNSTKAQVLMN